MKALLGGYTHKDFHRVDWGSMGYILCSQKESK